MGQLHDYALAVATVFALLMVASTIVPGVAATGLLPGQDSSTTAGGAYSARQATNETETAAPTPTETATSTPTPNPDGTATPTGGNGTDTEQTGPPLVVENLTVTEEVRNGETMTVTVTVRNSGEQNATGPVRYSFNATTVQARTLTVAPGTTETLAFEVSTADLQNGSLSPGAYVHGVRNASGDGIPRRIRVTPDADLRMEGFDAPVAVSRDNEVIVLATAVNPAEMSITRRVTYRFAGRSIANKTVTVPGGGERQVAIAVDLSTVEDAGVTVENGTTYDHAVVAAGGASTGDAIRVRRGPSADASALAVEAFQTPGAIRRGERLSVNVTVRNVGSVPFEGQLAYRVDDAVVATSWVDVPVGEQQEVRFRPSYADVDRAVIPVSSRQTTHGVWAGNTSLRERPVTVDTPTSTETQTPTSTPTFDPLQTKTTTPTPQNTSAGSTCQRDFFTECGGSPLDQATLTLLGALASVLGIVFELVRGN